ncbi:MAG: hypothetical protein KatS3mg054_0121 [Chloroflexus sp.]|nr:MAG: hypothetical protein KatS3mg054_0121 [Chloroflexus sp.]
MLTRLASSIAVILLVPIVASAVIKSSVSITAESLDVPSSTSGVPACNRDAAGIHCDIGQAVIAKVTVPNSVQNLTGFIHMFSENASTQPLYYCTEVTDIVHANTAPVGFNSNTLHARVGVTINDTTSTVWKSSPTSATQLFETLSSTYCSGTGCNGAIHYLMFKRVSCNSICVASANPLPCCSGNGTGTCTDINASNTTLYGVWISYDGN